VRCGFASASKSPTTGGRPSSPASQSPKVTKVAAYCRRVLALAAQRRSAAPRRTGCAPQAPGGGEGGARSGTGASTSVGDGLELLAALRGRERELQVAHGERLFLKRLVQGHVNRASDGKNRWIRPVLGISKRSFRTQPEVPPIRSSRSTCVWLICCASHAVRSSKSHVYRNPLATIESYLEALADGILPANEENWSAIRAETARLNRLVNDLQKVARAEAHELDLHPAPTSPDELVDDALKAAAPSPRHLSVANRRRCELQAARRWSSGRCSSKLMPASMARLTGQVSAARMIRRACSSVRSSGRLMVTSKWRGVAVFS
jgi:hypothetical protein